jgi:hypothetical protein
MAKNNTKVIMFGPYEDGNLAGIEKPEDLERVRAASRAISGSRISTM